MLYLTQNTNILLAIKPVDFRRQIDGLIALCKQTLLEEPHSGQLFVFINRPHTMIRVLCYDQGGYWLATKRLSQGRYRLWPSETQKVSQPMLASDLIKILKNIVAS